MTARGHLSRKTGALDRSGVLRDNKPAGGIDTAGDLKGRVFQHSAFLFIPHPSVGGERGDIDAISCKVGTGVHLSRVKPRTQRDLTLQKIERCQEVLMQSSV